MYSLLKLYFGHVFTDEPIIKNIVCKLNWYF